MEGLNESTKLWRHPKLLLFMTTILQENCRLKRDSNLDCQSRRQVC